MRQDVPTHLVTEARQNNPADGHIGERCIREKEIDACTVGIDGLGVGTSCETTWSMLPRDDEVGGPRVFLVDHLAVRHHSLECLSQCFRIATGHREHDFHGP